jgi:predicted ester cyclase
MVEAAEVEVRSWEVFNDHDERAPNIAELEFEMLARADRDRAGAGAGDDRIRLKGFPDARRTVHREVVSGRWVVQESTFEGTHTAPFEAPVGIIPPTGKRVVVKCVQIGRYENGRATEIKLYYDQVELLSQLGVIPERRGPDYLVTRAWGLSSKTEVAAGPSQAVYRDSVTRPVVPPVEDPYSGWK